MKSATLQVGVELNLLQTAGRTLALLVAGGHVTGRGLTLGLGLRAFQDDDISRHNCDVVDLRAPILHYSSLSSREIALSMSFCKSAYPTWSCFLAL